MVKVYFEDYEIGEKILTPGRTITETDLVMFSAYTGDWHEHHTNIEYAKTTIFGERIAHGMLVLVVGMNLALRLGENRYLPKSFIALQEINKVRFHEPVKIGDTIYLEVEVVSLTEKGKNGLVTTYSRIYNQKNKNVCTYEAEMLCKRKPAN